MMRPATFSVGEGERKRTAARVDQSQDASSNRNTEWQIQPNADVVCATREGSSPIAERGSAVIVPRRPTIYGINESL